MKKRHKRGHMCENSYKNRKRKRENFQRNLKDSYISSEEVSGSVPEQDDNTGKQKKKITAQYLMMNITIRSPFSKKYKEIMKKGLAQKS